MQELLSHKLYSYLIEHNPEIILNLEQHAKVSEYIQGKIIGIQSYLDALLDESKPAYIVEELCLKALTEDLRPSRYLFIKEILEEEFTGDYLVLTENGTLTYEIANLITVCKQIFQALGFSRENENNRIIRYAIIGQIKEYLTATR